MKILVTGSEGTLGKPLCEELKSRGHDLVRVDIRHEPDRYDSFVRADIGLFRQVRRVFIEHPDIELVYNLAAEFGRNNGEEYYENLWRSNAVGLKNILHLQREFGFRLIHASSSEVYGELKHNGGEPVLESITEDIPLFHMNDYAMSKWVNEQQIRNEMARHKSEIMTLRFFNAYGPGEYYNNYRSVVCLFVYRALMGMPFDVSEGHHRVFMYVDDVIPTVANAAERFMTGMIFNIGGKEYRSVEDLADIVVRETGCSPDLARRVGAEEFCVLNKRADIEMARVYLGHDPEVGLEEGVARTVEWMKQVYGI